MISARASNTEEDRGWRERAGADRASARWLINGTQEETGEPGVIGIVALERDGAVPPHRHPGEESAVVVLDGAPTVACTGGIVAARPGTVIHAPAGSWYGIDAGASACRLMVVFASARTAQSVVWERAPAGADAAGPPVTVLDTAAAPEIEMHDPRDGRHHVTARRLIDGELCGARGLIIGHCSFGPASLHERHRHPGAGEALYAYAGSGSHLTEGEPVPQRAGELVYVPAGEWHGLRGPREGTLLAFFVLLGVAAFDAAGYELHDPRWPRPGAS